MISPSRTVTARGALPRGKTAAPVEEPEAFEPAMRVMTWTAVIIVFTQKLALPGTSGALQLMPFIYYGVMAYLLFKGYVRISAARFFLFSATVGIAAFMHAIFHGDRFSLPSFGFYVAIYASSIFVLPTTEKQYVKMLKALQDVGVFGGIWVLLDLIVQRLGKPIPNIEKVIPSFLLLKDFAYMREVKFGSPYFKPNGLIFLEPSHVSQFLAFCLFAELVFFRRTWRTGFYFITMFLTSGGTGLLLVVLTAPFLLGYLRPSVTIALIVVSMVGLFGGLAAGLLDEMVGRLDEFNNPRSSAYYRFVAPLKLMSDVFAGDTIKALVGSGAGNSPKQNAYVIWIPLAKVLYEYGIVFTLFWFPLTLASTFGQGRIFIMSWMMFMQYHLLNGSLLVPLNFIYVLIFGGLYELKVPPPPQLLTRKKSEAPVQVSVKPSEGSSLALR